MLFLSKRYDFLGQSRIDPNSHFSGIPMSLFCIAIVTFQFGASFFYFLTSIPSPLSPSVTIVRPLSQWRGSWSGCERCGEHRERLLSAIRKQLGHHLGYQLVEPGEDQPDGIWRFWEVQVSIVSIVSKTLWVNQWVQWKRFWSKRLLSDCFQ